MEKGDLRKGLSDLLEKGAGRKRSQQVFCYRAGSETVGLGGGRQGLDLEERRRVVKIFS